MGNLNAFTFKNFITFSGKRNLEIEKKFYNDLQCLNEIQIQKLTGIFIIGDEMSDVSYGQNGHAYELILHADSKELNTSFTQEGCFYLTYFNNTEVLYLSDEGFNPCRINPHAAYVKMQ